MEGNSNSDDKKVENNSERGRGRGRRRNRRGQLHLQRQSTQPSTTTARPSTGPPDATRPSRSSRPTAENGTRPASALRNKNNGGNNNKKKKKGNGEDLELREKLVKYLNANELECMICYDKVQRRAEIWSCDKCFAIFHLHCIQKWSSASSASSSAGSAQNLDCWRCPGCQFERRAQPKKYFCFCGKVERPSADRLSTPHSCGKVCGRPLAFGTACPHSCTLLCHPGPCPPCDAMAPRSLWKCYCGRQEMPIRCSDLSIASSSDLDSDHQKQGTVGRSCDQICLKLMKCGRHKCQKTCHAGPCDECDQEVRQFCHCGKSFREIRCGSETAVGSKYSCGRPCGRLFKCGVHHCQEICHQDNIQGHRTCSFDPSIVSTCPCGKTSISSLLLNQSSAAGDLPKEQQQMTRRIICTDPVPTCGKVCGKVIQKPCGHWLFCDRKCHFGPCPATATSEKCLELFQEKCQCGSTAKEIFCFQRFNDGGDNQGDKQGKEFLCQRECRQMKSCGQHRCKNICCASFKSPGGKGLSQGVAEGHECEVMCDRPLTCGNHRCQSTCHRGKCPTCREASFNDWNCHCGRTVVHAPIRCGTKMPDCKFPCTRDRPCGHATNLISPHNCHPDSVPCPPCMIFVRKRCLCGKQELPSVACSKSGRCPLVCGKPLPGCDHLCTRGCHDGECLERPCSQPCGVHLPCGHQCRRPCHPSHPDCLTSGSGTESSESGDECHELVSVKCQCGNQQLQVPCFRKQQTPQLPCNQDCLRLQRNQRLAQALNIHPEDSILRPRTIPTRIKLFAQRFPKFSALICLDLLQMIAALSNSNSAFVVKRFSPMRSEYRQFIHVLVEEFASTVGFESEAVDPEPNRSVVVRQTKPVDVVGPQSLKFAREMITLVSDIAVSRQQGGGAVEKKLNQLTLMEQQAEDEDLMMEQGLVVGRSAVCSLDHFHLLACIPKQLSVFQSLPQELLQEEDVDVDDGFTKTRNKKPQMQLQPYKPGESLLLVNSSETGIEEMVNKKALNDLLKELLEVIGEIEIKESLSNCYCKRKCCLPFNWIDSSPSFNLKSVEISYTTAYSVSVEPLDPSPLSSTLPEASNAVHDQIVNQNNSDLNNQEGTECKFLMKIISSRDTLPVYIIDWLLWTLADTLKVENPQLRISPFESNIN